MTYKVQINDQIREATSEEIGRIEAETIDVAAKVAAHKTAKQSAYDKLKALGLTDAEIAALVS